MKRMEPEKWPGQPFPLGASYDGVGTNFALFSEVAERVELCLFDDAGGSEKRLDVTEADGYVWHCFLPGVGPGVDVDRLKQPDLLAVRVDDVVLPPVADVLSLEHGVDLPFLSLSKRFAQVTAAPSGALQTPGGGR